MKPDAALDGYGFPGFAGIQDGIEVQTGAAWISPGSPELVPLSQYPAIAAFGSRCSDGVGKRLILIGQFV